MNYSLKLAAAGTLIKAAKERRFPSRTRAGLPDAGEILPEGNALSDWLLLPSRGSDRAGRAEVLAKSIGQDPGFNVTHPQTSSALGAIGGSLLGAGAGGLTGAGIGRLAALFAGDQGEDVERKIGGGGAIGAVAGAGLGSLISTILLTRARRKRMREIKEDYDASEDVAPYMRTGNPLSIASGAHDDGRAQALLALLGQPYAERPSNATNVSAAAIPLSLLAPGAPLGTAASLGGSIYNKFDASDKNRQILRGLLRHDPDQRMRITRENDRRLQPA